MKISKKKVVLMMLLLIIIIQGFVLAYAYYLHSDRPSFKINGITVNDFAYWLNGPKLDELIKTKYDLLIIDYSKDGSDDNAFTIDEIKQIKNSGHIVISYLSIGEAESYRYYWNESWDQNHDGIPDDDAPDWLGQENPSWPGNYAVRYWDPEWQSIIFGNNDSYLDKIINAGFDGVMLDKVDEFEYFESENNESYELMIDFILKIINYAKSKNPDFLVFIQNGEKLLNNDTLFDAISGFVKEDLYFEGNIMRSRNEINTTLSILKQLSAQKPVLVVEYPTLYPFKLIAYLDAYSDGFLVYVGPRELNSLWTTFPFYPD
ncbi:MAG: MJ1477/TM1410 family putative glycoside hydrolase [Candidatus Asgardarchaeia archaeon]